MKKLIDIFNTSVKISRRISTNSFRFAAYENDGKTTVTVLNKEPGFGIMIDSYSKFVHVFILGNKMINFPGLTKFIFHDFIRIGGCEIVVLKKISMQGFRLNNGLFVFGPMVLFPHTAFSWKVSGDEEINTNSLELFGLIEPKLDLLVIGFGKKSTDTRVLNKEVLSLKSKSKINIEVLPTDKAVATFNYLSSERRWVAGAFIPPEKILISEDELLAHRAQQKEAYDVERLY